MTLNVESGIYRLRLSMPGTDNHFRYEVLGALPETIAPQSSVTVPYRVVMVEPLASTGEGSGGGCYTYNQQAEAECDYDCANEDVRQSSALIRWHKSDRSGCSGDGGGSGGGGGGGSAIIGIGGGASGGGVSFNRPPAEEEPPMACPGSCEGPGCGDASGSSGADYARFADFPDIEIPDTHIESCEPATGSQ